MGALLLGVHEKNGELRYAGRVGTGFDHATLVALEHKLSRLHTGASPFSRAPAGRLARDVHWIKPTLVAEVSFAEWTHDGHVRQASFEGLREDKPQAEVTREAPREIPQAREGARRAAARPGAAKVARASPPMVGGVKISNPERLVYPAYATVTVGNMSALDDQAIAGVIMWIPGSLIFLVAAMWLVVEALNGTRAIRAIAPAR